MTSEHTAGEHTHDGTSSKSMGEQRTDPRPSWKALLERHAIDPERLARLLQSLSTLSYEEALQVVREARGTPARVDIALLALSRLTKVAYSRRTVGGFTFIAPEEASQPELQLPLDTPQRYLDGLRAHGGAIQDTVYPSDQPSVSGIPAPYLIVSFPLGTLLAFEKPGACTQQAFVPDDLTAYFPDGYILHTCLMLAWGIAYYVVISQQESAAGPLRASREQRKDNV